LRFILRAHEAAPAQAQCRPPETKNSAACPHLKQLLLKLVTFVFKRGYGLEAGKFVFDYRKQQEIFFLLCSIQTGSGANSASYPFGYQVRFPRGQSNRSVKLTTSI
jgi:hypothetical protein